MQAQETAEDLQNKLDNITELPESDSYPLFHLLPEVLQHCNKLMLLPPEMKGFLVESKTPEACLKVAREITIAAYEGARKVLGDSKAVVCIPPKELLQVFASSSVIHYDLHHFMQTISDSISSHTGHT